MDLLWQMGISLNPSVAWQMPVEVKGSLYLQIDYDSLFSRVDNESAKFQPSVLV